MAKVRTSAVDSQTRKQIVGDFLDVIVYLKTKQEAVSFLLGLLTASEALMIARRIQIAQMLLAKKSYDAIRTKLHVGVDTITKIDRWLHTDDAKRDQWLQSCLAKKKKKAKTGTTGRYYENPLDYYPQYRFIKELFGVFD